MNYDIRYIVPQVQYEARRASETRPFYLEWKSPYNLSQIIPPPPRIEFTHDPHWHTRFLSIQSAHDGSHPVWRVAHIVGRISPILWL